jgi:hypothetical protein
MAAWSILKRLWRLSTVLWLMVRSCLLLLNVMNNNNFTPIQRRIMAFNHMDKEQQITSEMREYYFQDFEIDMKMAIESNQFALCIPNHIQ